MNGRTLVSRAADFAARRHVNQRRKGQAGGPYLNHLAEVAALLAEATDGADPALVAAGWLRDTLEDTATKREELAEAFGEEVAALVAEVTDDKSLDKHVRKRSQVENAPRKSDRAKLLKTADKTSNLRSLASSPPHDWESGRREDYIGWAEQAAAGCRTGDARNARLERAFDAAVLAARSGR